MMSRSFTFSVAMHIASSRSIRDQMISFRHQSLAHNAARLSVGMMLEGMNGQRWGNILKKSEPTAADSRLNNKLISVTTSTCLTRSVLLVAPVGRFQGDATLTGKCHLTDSAHGKQNLITYCTNNPCSNGRHIIGHS